MRILICLILFTSITVFGQDKQLKQKTEIHKNQDGETTFKIVEDYNVKGYKYKRSVLNSQKKVTSYRSYNIDSVGCEISDTGFNNNNEVIDIWSYKYDSNNEVVVQTRKYPKRNDFYIEFYDITYDASNNIIVQKRFDKDSTLNWVYNYYYNEDNLQVRYTSKFRGTLRNERVYRYKKGLKVSEILYDYENKELRQRENTLYFYKYDKSGNLIKRTVHSVAEHLKQKIITEYKYSYDKDGKLISEIRMKDGKLNSSTKYEYKYW